MATSVEQHLIGQQTVNGHYIAANRITTSASIDWTTTLLAITSSSNNNNNDNDYISESMNVLNGPIHGPQSSATAAGPGHHIVGQPTSQHHFSTKSVESLSVLTMHHSFIVGLITSM